MYYICNLLHHLCLNRGTNSNVLDKETRKCRCFDRSTVTSNVQVDYRLNQPSWQWRFQALRRDAAPDEAESILPDDSRRRIARSRYAGVQSELNSSGNRSVETQQRRVYRRRGAHSPCREEKWKQGASRFIHQATSIDCIVTLETRKMRPSGCPRSDEPELGL